MNSGKTYAATEIIQQGTRAGLRVAAAKLSGIACLRDTLNMADHGAIATASFLDCGLPSTVGAGDLAPVARAIIARLNESAPDLIVIELGDGILGGYSVESIFEDAEFREAMTALVFCASDYVGAWGGIEAAVVLETLDRFEQDRVCGDNIAAVGIGAAQVKERQSTQVTFTAR